MIQEIRFADNGKPVAPIYSFMELKHVELMIKAELVANITGRVVEIVEIPSAAEESHG